MPVEHEPSHTERRQQVFCCCCGCQKVKRSNTPRNPQADSMYCLELQGYRSEGMGVMKDLLVLIVHARYVVSLVNSAVKVGRKTGLSSPCIPSSRLEMKSGSSRSSRGSRTVSSSLQWVVMSGTRNWDGFAPIFSLASFFLRSIQSSCLFPPLGANQTSKLLVCQLRFSCNVRTGRQGVGQVLSNAWQEKQKPI